MSTIDCCGNEAIGLDGPFGLSWAGGSNDRLLPGLVVSCEFPVMVMACGGFFHLKNPSSVEEVESCRKRPFLL